MRVRISPTWAPTPGFVKIFAENYRPLASANDWSPFGRVSDSNTRCPRHRENREFGPLLFPDRENSGSCTAEVEFEFTT